MGGAERKDGGACLGGHVGGRDDHCERAVLQQHRTGGIARLVERLLQPQLALMIRHQPVQPPGGLGAGLFIRRTAVQKRGEGGYVLVVSGLPRGAFLRGGRRGCLPGRQAGTWLQRIRWRRRRQTQPCQHGRRRDQYSQQAPPQPWKRPFFGASLRGRFFCVHRPSSSITNTSTALSGRPRSVRTARISDSRTDQVIRSFGHHHRARGAVVRAPRASVSPP